MSRFIRKLADSTAGRQHHSDEYSEEPPGATEGPAVETATAVVGHSRRGSSLRVPRRHQPVCTISRRRRFWWARWLVLSLTLLGVVAKVLLLPQQQSSSGTTGTNTRTNILNLRSKGPLKDANTNNTHPVLNLDAVDPGAGGGADNRGGDGDDDEGEENSSGLRVAVCFFGLTRSLRWTLPSVQERLLGVLKEAGMQVDVFVHTYDLVQVNNLRAGETGVEYGSYVNDFQALNPTRSLVTNQDDFDLAWPNPLRSTHYNWIYKKEEAGGVIRNVLRAYWSMSMVWGLMAEHAVQGRFQYDAVVLARPDVWFHYDVDLPSREFPLPEQAVFLPSFDAEASMGARKNDRFAYGSVAAMRVVMNRIPTLLEADAGQYLGDIDSEWVLGHHLREHDISVYMLDLLVTRIRLTRDIPRYDHRLVEEACQSGKDPMACRIMEAGFQFPMDGGST